MSLENTQAEPIQPDSAETEIRYDTTENPTESESVDVVASEAAEIQENTLQLDQVQSEDGIKDDAEVQEHLQIDQKENEETSDENIVEKQDAEEVKEENEGSTEETRDETTSGDFEPTAPTSTGLAEMYLKLIEQEQEEGEEEEEEDEVGLKVTLEKTERKKSKVFRRSTLSSLQLETRGPTISGDFLPLGASRSTLETVSVISSVDRKLDDQEDKEDRTKEEEDTEKKDEEPSIFMEYTREECYEMYNNLHEQYHEEKLKNNFLLKKLVNYYTHKKMFHVVKEGKLKPDALTKYKKQLDDFEQLTTDRLLEHMDIEQEVNNLKAKLLQKENEAQARFENLQRKEYEVGKEIVDSANHDERLIDRYLKRQKIQLNILKKTRLGYIKIRNKVTKIQESLDSLDNLGPNLRLVDYEQLKHDNKNLMDKLDEKDLELTRVRSKCQHTAQALAHRREKVSALEADLDDMKETLERLTGEREDVRQQLNELKQNRDLYRFGIENIKKNAGILSQPKLWRNMCETLKLSVSLANELEEIKSECKVLNGKVERIRKNMSSVERMKKIEYKMKMGESPPSSDMFLDTFSFSTSNSNLN
ncbi:golgin subfamily A member 6-like protein 22 [Zophobas morio]|uniref:golgin subfamily A member 6-like protein 22 n=1 Tax=Zophobas morio TaxID=2755281 RepID=UPI003082BD14